MPQEHPSLRPYQTVSRFRYRSSSNSQQSIIFALLVLAKGDPVDVLLLLRQLEVDKLHVLLTAETKVMYEGLEKSLAFAAERAQLPSDLGVEDLGLFDATGDVEELDDRVQILDRVDAISCKQSCLRIVWELTLGYRLEPIVTRLRSRMQPGLPWFSRCEWCGPRRGLHDAI